MAEKKRKEIPKRIRFEVFKRDSFTCQYCGRMSPDVVLQVDHIKPVSKGGKNEILNLITSCADCNLGKSDVELSDDTAIKKQEKQLLELAEKKEQLEMMLKWREGLNNIENDKIDAVADIFEHNTDWGVSAHEKQTIKKWVKSFSLNEVMDAAEIAINTYYDGTEAGWNTAFNKVSGICYNKRKQADDPRYYKCNYLIKIAKNNYNYCDVRRLKAYLLTKIADNDDFEMAKAIMSKARHWSQMKEDLEEQFGGNV